LKEGVTFHLLILIAVQAGQKGRLYQCYIC